MASLSRHIWQIFCSSFVVIDCCCIGQLSPHKHFQTPNLFLILCNIKSYFSKGVSCPVFLSGQYPVQGTLYKWMEHSNFPVQGRGDSKTPIPLLRPNIFLYPCRKFSELSNILFLSSTPSSQNLKFIKNYPYLSSLKTKFY